MVVAAGPMYDSVRFALDFLQSAAGKSIRVQMANIVIT